MSDKKDEKTAAIKSNNTDSGQLNGTADLKSDTADKRESAPTFAMHNVSPPTESPEENKEKKTIDVLPDGTGDDASDQEGENGSYCESLDDRNDAGAEVEPDLNGARGGAATMTDLVPTPPDGGYGWIVVLAAFVSNFIVDGTSNSFGAFITTYQEHFGESKAIVSLIGSILIGSYLLIGPFASGLLNKYGARVVVVVGSVLSGLSFAASTLSPNVYVYMFFYGFLSGIGFGFIYVPAVVFVSFYFEKKRSLATGLAVAGSGVGTFAMPPMCIYFLNNYGWKITVGVLAGCALLCGAFGLLYKPLESPKAVDDAEKEPLRVDDEEMQRPASDLSCHQNHSDSPKRENSVPINATTEDGDTATTGNKVFARVRSAHSECETVDESQRAALWPVTEHESALKKKAGTNYFHGDRSGLPPARGRKSTLTSLGSDLHSSQEIKHSSRQNLSSQLSRISARSYAQSISRLCQNPQMKQANSLISVVSSIDPKEFVRPMNRRDIFYQGSIHNLREFDDEGRSYRSYRESNISIPAAVATQGLSAISVGEDLSEIHDRTGGSRHLAEGLPEEEGLLDYYDDGKCKWIPPAIRHVFTEMMDFGLLKEPVMMLLCISNLLGMLGFYVPFMFCIDAAVEKGITKSNASLLLSIIGITNTLGRIVFGWLADRGWMSALNINNLCLVACGVLTCGCPFLPNFMLLVVYAALFGFIISAYICLTSIVLADLLGLDRLTNSFGLLVVSRGIASLLGTPIAGLVYDLTKSYDASFYFAGGLIIFAGLVSCTIPYFSKNKNKKEAKKDAGSKGGESDAVSGKLSVVTEHSEENLTEYQRTIQSLRQQQKLLQEYDDERKRLVANRTKPITVTEGNEEADD